MSFNTLILIISSVSLSAAAQILFKFGVMSVRGKIIQSSIFGTFTAYLVTPGVIGGLALYGIGTVLWLSVLSRIDVSQAYPFVGVGFVLTAIFGAMLFGDHVGIMRIGGMALVVCGIYFVARS